MRFGQNPAKKIDEVAQPERITVALITYIPFLSGYYAQSLDVLRVCLGSLVAHTTRPFDLLVFDNASCPETVSYLVDLKEKGIIQYLILAEKNYGKVGAWNFIFRASPGEYIAYADSDVYFYPGWLEKHLQVFAAFPEAGTVTGLPRRGRRTFYTRTIEQLGGLRDAVVEVGKFIPDEWILDHARTLGKLETVQEDLDKDDYRITRGGVTVYATATHFQFMVKSETVRKYLPFASDRPMGDNVAQFDRAIDEDQFLRLATAERVVRHVGNTLDLEFIHSLPDYIRDGIKKPEALISTSRRTAPARLFAYKPVKRILLRLYDWIFRLYYR